jgi:WD40 repeat protein
MIKSAIYELAVSRDSCWLAAAQVERTIQIWDLHTRRRTLTLSTVFESGAKTLTISPSGDFVFVGSSARGYVEAYEIPSGRPVWKRKLQKYVSYLSYSPVGDYLWITAKDQSLLERIDPQRGTTLETIKGAALCVEGGYGHALISGRPGRTGSPYLLRRNGRTVEIVRVSFALLGVSFSPDSVCLTESVGPVRCIDYKDGRERWRFTPEAGSHVLSLYYSERNGFYYGVLRHYQSGLYRRLLRFAPETGAMKTICDLDSWEEAFIPAAHQLVTSAGYMIDLETGRTAAQLDFPQREYPDSTEAWEKSRAR